MADEPFSSCIKCHSNDHEEQPHVPCSQQKHLIKINKTKRGSFPFWFEFYLSVGLSVVSLLGHRGLFTDTSAPKVNFYLFILQDLEFYPSLSVGIDDI